MNFHDNSKNINRKNDFSSVSSHSASLMKMGSKLREERRVGGGSALEQGLNMDCNYIPTLDLETKGFFASKSIGKNATTIQTWFNSTRFKNGIIFV